MLPTKFQVKWRFGSGEDAKNSFSRWPPQGPSWISDRNKFSFFFINVTPMLPTKFCQLAFWFRRRLENKFSRWPTWRQSWISDWNDFSCFQYTSHPDASWQVSSKLVFWFGRRSEKHIFKMAAMAAILNFRSERF